MPPRAGSRGRDLLDEGETLRLVPAERDVEPAARQQAALRGQDVAGNEACVFVARGADRN
jgi:hypothetical protein